MVIHILCKALNLGRISSDATLVGRRHKTIYKLFREILAKRQIFARREIFPNAEASKQFLISKIFTQNRVHQKLSKWLPFTI
jgi:hypothetical protein